MMAVLPSLPVRRRSGNRLLVARVPAGAGPVSFISNETGSGHGARAGSRLVTGQDELAFDMLQCPGPDLRYPVSAIQRTANPQARTHTPAKMLNTVPVPGPISCGKNWPTSRLPVQ